MGEIAGDSKNILSIFQSENAGSAEREVRGEEHLLRYLQSLIECPVCLTTIRSIPVTNAAFDADAAHRITLSAGSLLPERPHNLQGLQGAAGGLPSLQDPLPRQPPAGLPHRSQHHRQDPSPVQVGYYPATVFRPLNLKLLLNFSSLAGTERSDVRCRCWRGRSWMNTRRCAGRAWSTVPTFFARQHTVWQSCSPTWWTKTVGPSTSSSSARTPVAAGTAASS